MRKSAGAPELASSRLTKQAVGISAPFSITRSRPRHIGSDLKWDEC